MLLHFEPSGRLVTAEDEVVPSSREIITVGQYIQTLSKKETQVALHPVRHTPEVIPDDAAPRTYVVFNEGSGTTIFDCKGLTHEQAEELLDITHTNGEITARFTGTLVSACKDIFEYCVCELVQVRPIRDMRDLPEPVRIALWENVRGAVMLEAEKLFTDPRDPAWFADDDDC